MNKETLRLCKRFRNAGYRAAESLRDAKIVAEFDELEGRGLVRIQAKPEQDNYFDVFGKPDAYVNGNGRRVSAKQAYDELVATLERDGVWYVESEYFDGTEWQFADGLGMCTGYNDPTSPFENSYVPDMMNAAIDALKAFWESEQPGEHDFAELEEA